MWVEGLLEKVRAEISATEQSDLPGARLQGDVTKRLKPVLGSVREAIAQHFSLHSDGMATGRALTAVMDETLAGLYRIASLVVYPSASQTVADSMQVVALGGYGRGVLAPYSDVDVMFLLPYKRTARAEQIVEFVLYVLWDLGVKIGHSVRSVEECVRLSKTDMVIRTSLLDMRGLTGEQALMTDLVKRMTRDVLAGTDKAFVAAKLAERDQRLEKAGDSRYRLEPNVKNGTGGLRDLHFIMWVSSQVWRTADPSELVRLGIFVASEARAFARAEAFLWTVRIHLHYLLGRAEERLTFEVEQEIARRLGYTDRSGTLEVERFMKRYFLVVKEVGELGRVFLSAVDAELSPEWRFLALPIGVEGFPLRQEQVSIPDPKHFERTPLDLIRIFMVAAKHGRPIHPRAESAITRSRGLINAGFRADPAANALLLGILDGPGPDIALQRMNEAGILGRFLPDWGRVVGQMQYDMYHVYTVDEHTLKVIGNLGRIERGELETAFPLATAAFRKLSSRRELYVALMMHDIAKGRGGDHSIIGEQVAKKFCRRLGLSDAETETVAWLVRYHLSMSDVALKRDLEDEKTITDFAELVQSPERLRLLLVLTTCDIEAVGPGRWNSWKAGLLSELFAHTSDMLSGTPTSRGVGSRVRVAQELARKELADWSDREFESFAALGSPGYWLAYDAIAHAWHARMIGDAESMGEPLSVATRIDAVRAVTEIVVYAPDSPRLFSHLAGAIAATGFTIIDAKISPLTNGRVLDIFSVLDAHGETGDVGDRREKLAEILTRSLEGTLSLDDALAKRSTTLIGRTRALPAPPRVLIDNDVSQGFNVIEVNGRDRPGLLYALTSTLNDIGVRISSAKISTYGHRVVDVFYVTDHNGAKIVEGAWLHHIYVKLMEVLGVSIERAA
jgi:[protein-PII] uridylyltransferase